MVRSLWMGFLTLAVAAIPASAASATFQLNIDFCTDPCLAGGGSGQVTLTEGTGSGIGGNGIPTGDLQFNVALTSPLDFHQTNGLDAFNFNFSPSVGGQTISIVSITSGYSSTLLTGQHEDGAGVFTDTVKYLTSPGVDGQSLIFTLAPNSGSLSISEFEVVSTGGSPNVDFAANVSNGTCTGLIGGGSGATGTSAHTNNPGGTCTAPPGVPEPTSILLLGTALAISGRLLKGYLA